MWPIRSGVALWLVSCILISSCADKRQLAVLRSAEGAAHLEERALERALAAFEEAASLDPTNPDPLVGLGRAHLASGQYQQALGALTRAAELAPATPEVAGLTALCRLGTTGYLTGPIPPGATAAHMRARLDVEALQAELLPPELLEDLARAAGGEPGDPATAAARWALAQAHYGRALALRRSGDLTGAIEAYRQAVAAVPGVGEAGLLAATTYGYGESGRVAWRADAAGDTTAYRYHPLGRLARARYADGSEVVFKYDGEGRRRRLTDPTGTTRFTYDRAGRLARVEYPGGAQVRIEHSPEGTPTTTHLPGGAQVVRRYDEAGRLAVAASELGEIRWTYGPAGELVEIDRPNGIATRYEYDADGRPATTVHARAGTPFLEYRFTLDSAGRPVRRVQIQDGATTVTELSYDLAGRVVEEREPGGRWTRYEYDLAGNRVRAIAPGDTVEYLYGAQHRLQVAGDTWLDYDAEGRAVRQLSADGAVAYSYDGEGRLLAVSGPEGSAELIYRGDGVLSGGTDASGQPVRILSDQAGRPLAVEAAGEIRPVVIDDAGAVFQWGEALYLRDAPRGNVVAASWADGSVSPVARFAAFGVVAAKGRVDGTGTVPEETGGTEAGAGPASVAGGAAGHGFRGAWQVGSTGLVLLDGRPYDPALGRFLTPEWSAAPQITRFRNPYQDLEFTLSAAPAASVLDKAARWVKDDPLATAVADALAGSYAAPLKVGPERTEPPSAAALLDDPRLPPSLSGPARDLFADQIARPEASRFSAALPSAPQPAAHLGAGAARIATAHVAARWGRTPGQRLAALAAAAGITTSAGGLTRAGGWEEDPSLERLEGFDALFGTGYVPLDSSWYPEYQSAVSAAASGRGEAAALAALAAAHGDGPWVAQLEILRVRELLRDERPHAALEVLARLGRQVAGTEWEDDVLVARVAAARRAGSAEEAEVTAAEVTAAEVTAAEVAVAELTARHPDSPWLDDARYLLGLCYQEDGQLARAAEILGNLAADPPQSVWTVEAVLQRPAYAYLQRLSRISGASFDAGTRQLVLAGEWDPALPPLDMDDLAVALRAIYVTRQDPAVSIGTEPSGRPGYKKVRYDGGTRGTTFGHTMFAADYVLKTLSIGQDSTGAPVQPDLEGYRSAVDWTVELEGLSLGMTWNSQVWFVPEEVVVSRLEEGVGISIAEVRMVVESQSKFARRRIAHEGVEAFARYLTDQYPRLEEQYPSVAKLSQLARLVAIAKWMRDDRIPVDLAWLEGYRFEAVACPDLVKASSASRETRTGDSTWDAVKLEMEGGVSFREPNQYRPQDQRAARIVAEALAQRPPGAERATWTYAPEGDGEQEQRAVALPLGAARRDGNLRLAHADLLPLPNTLSASLVRYYDSFDPSPGPFGSGWHLPPYALLLRRDLSGAPGDRGEMVEGDLATLEDRANGGSESQVLVSEYSRGPGLRRVFGGGYALSRPSGVELIFDEAGRLLKQTDGAGGQVEYRRDGDRILSVSDHLGRRIDLTWSAAGLVTAAADNAGNTVRYGYDEEGRLVQVEGAGGAPLQYGYDVSGRLVRARTGTPESFQVAYDGLGRMRLFQGRDGQSRVFRYDAVGRRSETAGAGGSGARVYDSEFRLVQSEEGVRYAYTADGDVAQVADPGGQAVEFGYDYAGNLVEIRDPKGRSTYLRYGDHGLGFVETAPGTGRALEYDDRGRLRRVADGASTRPGGAAAPRAAVTELEYDERGLVSAVSVGAGGKVTVKRDRGGQVVELRGPGGQVLVVERDASGRVAGLRDGAGRSVALERDAAGRLRRLRTAAAEFEYEYDEEGRLKSLAGPGGARTEVVYANGRSRALEFADGARMEYTYDELGRLVALADPAGVRLVREYDDRGRVIAVRRVSAAGEITTAPGAP